MKCSNPVDVASLVFARTDQPEVVELQGDDAWKQWNLAQRLSEPAKVEFWEKTVPMELL